MKDSHVRVALRAHGFDSLENPFELSEVERYFPREPLEYKWENGCLVVNGVSLPSGVEYLSDSAKNVNAFLCECYRKIVELTNNLSELLDVLVFKLERAKRFEALLQALQAKRKVETMPGNFLDDPFEWLAPKCLGPLSLVEDLKSGINRPIL